MLEYKIIAYNTKALPTLGEDNWNLKDKVQGRIHSGRLKYGG